MGAMKKSWIYWAGMWVVSMPACVTDAVVGCGRRHGVARRARAGGSDPSTVVRCEIRAGMGEQVLCNPRVGVGCFAVATPRAAAKAGHFRAHRRVRLVSSAASDKLPLSAKVAKGNVPVKRYV